MSQPHEPREVFPVRFYEGQRPVEGDKDFAIRPVASSTPEPQVVEEVEELGSDPKGYSVTESAEFSDLIPSAAEAMPAGVELELEPTTTDPSKLTSSMSPATGKSEPSAVPVAATTPTTGSVKPQKRATAQKQSASPAP